MNEEAKEKKSVVGKALKTVAISGAIGGGIAYGVYNAQKRVNGSIDDITKTTTETLSKTSNDIGSKMAEGNATAKAAMDSHIKDLKDDLIKRSNAHSKLDISKKNIGESAKRYDEMKAAENLRKKTNRASKSHIINMDATKIGGKAFKGAKNKKLLNPKQASANLSKLTRQL